MALAAGAKGPHGLAHGNNSARALVPLHRVTDTATSGAISVRPYARGIQTIAWAVVTAGSCGERVLSRGERSIEVAVGPPEIVVQDRFATDAPIKRTRSPAGTHELLVFKDRYEIHDAVTGAKILERPGTWPAFSPTGRFVAARHTSRGDIEVFDLAVRTPDCGGERRIVGLAARRQLPHLWRRNRCNLDLEHACRRQASHTAAGAVMHGLRRAKRQPDLRP